jgi:hypothetical protein
MTGLPCTCGGADRHGAPDAHVEWCPARTGEFQVGLTRDEARLLLDALEDSRDIARAAASRESMTSWTDKTQRDYERARAKLRRVLYSSRRKNPEIFPAGSERMTPTPAPKDAA